MMPMQKTGVVSVMVPQSVGTAATATGLIDTLGFEECKIIFHLDTAAAVSNNPSTIKVAEGDTSTAFTDVTGFVGDATDGFTVPTLSTAAGNIVEFNMDLRGRKRYLKTTLCAAGAASIMGVTAVLSRAKDTSVAQAKAAAVVNG